MHYSFLIHTAFAYMWCNSDSSDSMASWSYGCFTLSHAAVHVMPWLPVTANNSRPHIRVAYQPHQFSRRGWRHLVTFSNTYTIIFFLSRQERFSSEKLEWKPSNLHLEVSEMERTISTKPLPIFLPNTEMTWVVFCFWLVDYVISASIGSLMCNKQV